MMQKYSGKKGRKAGSKSHGNENGRIQRDEVPEKVPATFDQLSMTFRYRFITTSAFSGVLGVTPYNLLDAWFLSGTATTAYQLFDFIKVKKVTVRAMNVGAQSAQRCPTATVGVEFFGLTGPAASGRQKEDTAIGTVRPAFVSLAPDKLSQAAQYQSATTNAFFSIRAIDDVGNPLIGTIIDVDVCLRNSADVNPAAVASARAGMTPGDLYFGGLDGQVLAATAARSAFQRRA